MHNSAQDIAGDGFVVVHDKPCVVRQVHEDHRQRQGQVKSGVRQAEVQTLHFHLHFHRNLDWLSPKLEGIREDAKQDCLEELLHCVENRIARKRRSPDPWSNAESGERLNATDQSQHCSVKAWAIFCMFTTNLVAKSKTIQKLSFSCKA